MGKRDSERILTTGILPSRYFDCELKVERGNLILVSIDSGIFKV